MNAWRSHARPARGPTPGARRVKPAQGAALGRLLICLCTAGVLAASSGCSRGPHHPDWVVHSGLEIVGPPPVGGYRLIFPYVVGDFYGPPNTGSFVTPVSQTPNGFTLDLNRTQEALQSELAPTDFSLGFLSIVPHEARIARLAPEALQRNGIDPVGRVEWLDAQSRRPLMLVYFDRPARIAGVFTRDGDTIRYDIHAVQPGYVWVGGVQRGGRDTLYTVVPRPPRLILTITTRRP